LEWGQLIHDQGHADQETSSSLFSKFPFIRAHLHFFAFRLLDLTDDCSTFLGNICNFYQHTRLDFQ